MAHANGQRHDERQIDHARAARIVIATAHALGYLRLGADAQEIEDPEDTGQGCSADAQRRQRLRAQACDEGCVHQARERFGNQ